MYDHRETHHAFQNESRDKRTDPKWELRFVLCTGMSNAIAWIERTWSGRPGTRYIRRKVKGSESRLRDRVRSWSGVAVIAFEECAPTVEMSTAASLVSLLKDRRINHCFPSDTQNRQRFTTNETDERERSNVARSSTRQTASRLSVRAPSETERNMQRLWRPYRANTRDNSLRRRATPRVVLVGSSVRIGMG